MIIEIVNLVEQNIVGRVANKVGDRRTDGLEVLLDHVERAGDGNYIEIGTLFGGSAIAVALYKKELGQSGYVFCIDPLNGYYTDVAPRQDMVDVQSGVPVTPETLFKNLKIFGVDNKVFVMRSKSDFVDYPIDIKFKVAFIDGNHREIGPLADFSLLQDVVTDYIVFDNHDEIHPAVIHAVDEAIRHYGWKKVHERDITCVLKHP